MEPTPFHNDGIAEFDSGIVGGTSWRGTLVSHNDYSADRKRRPTVLVLAAGEGSQWFVGFNEHHVTIVKIVDGQSSLKGVLYGGQSETISNWRESGKDLKVTVHEINDSADVETAVVEVILGYQPTASPTTSPTLVPTDPPTKPPTLSPTDHPTLKPTPPPTNYPTLNPTRFPTKKPTPSPTNVPTSWPTRRPTDKPTSQPTNFPTKSPLPEDPDNTCGNLLCSTSENPATCSSDCKVNVMKTATGYSNSNGLIFNIEAKKTATIFSFDVVGMKKGWTNCQVYTRPGTYDGRESSSGGWTRILDKNVYLRTGLSNMGGLDSEVRISSGEMQAFYVFCDSGLSHAAGSGRGGQFGTDGTIGITEGVETRTLFGGARGDARFSGWIRYYASA